MEWMSPIVVGALVGAFIAIVGWLLNRSIHGIDERASRTEQKVDGLVSDVADFRAESAHEIAKAHARISDTNERVAAVEARTDGRKR